jgi:M6 family metalloprotease-like protein
MRVSRRRLSGIGNVKVCLWLLAFQVLWCVPASGQTLGAPANLKAATLTANRVDLSWQDAVDGEDGFRVERAPDTGGLPGVFVEIATLPPDSTTFADKGLGTPAMAWYRVRAYRGSELGPYSNEVSISPCVGGAWRNMDTGGPATAGLGLREPPVPTVYGVERRNGAVVWPGCAVVGGPVRLPVLMVAWDDFDPRINPSNENNASSTFPEYVPSSPAQLQSYLQSEVAPYYRDVSGGRATLSFDVVGWINSGAPGGYLKPRSQYLYNLHDLNPSYPDPTWQCRSTDIFLDALRDAVRAGLDLSRYDLDGNGLIDGMVLVYEGKGGLCGGGNMSWVNSGYYTSPPAFQWLAARELVPPGDPNWPAFDAQPGWVHLFNNMPERLGDAANSFYYSATWAHELGHLLFGYPDYYYTKFNLGSWGLSGNHGAIPTHPAAFEKWLFGRWFDPTVVTATGEYTVAANEISDGGRYSGGPYLYQIPIDGDPNHFLTIEGRWFDADGNSGTRWAQANLRESGLLIVEFNLAQDWYSSTPQLYRHAPDRAGGAPAAILRAYRAGDRFSKCYATTCVTIEPTSAAGATFSFSVRFGANRSPVADAGGSYSGVANQAVALSGSGSSDPDGDPLTYQWTFGDGATGTGASVTHAYATAGSYPVTLVVSDGIAGSTSTTNVSVVDQSVTLTAPNTAVTWLAGSTQAIAWTHNLGAGSTVALDVSRDGGASWTAIAASVANTGATSGSFAWVVTNPPSASARIRVKTTSGAVSDASDVSFTIERPNQPPIASAGGPYSGVVSQPVAFSGSGSSDPDGDPLTYQWTFGDGATGTGASATHAYATTGSYPVTLVVSDGIASSTSTTNVSVVEPPSMTVTSPNTAVNWGVGSTQTIAWTHNLGTGSTVALDVSRDGGVTWTAIAASVTNTSATSGSYAWIVKGPATTSARVRVRPASGAGSDVNDSNFTIAAAFITVTSPKNGLQWTIGNTYAVTWNHNLGTLSSVKIEISRNNGSTWSVINGSVQSSGASTGSYNWTVSGPGTSTARIRVTWTTNSGVKDASNGSFVIR